MANIARAERPYTYTPLKNKDSIRLLKVEPKNSTFGRYLECDLVEVSLSVRPGYEAISYTWGDCILSAALNTKTGIIKITNNLATALSAFRWKDEPRYLWADAVCINQEDVLERGSQVAIMSQIYHNARCVLVWLGPGDDRTDHVYNLLRQLSSASKDYGVDPVSIESTQSAWNASAPLTPRQKELLDSIAVDYDFYGMDEFYSNPWFQRLWIIQEIALACRIQVHCGEHEIAWENLITAATVQYRSVNQATLSNLRLPRNLIALTRIEDARADFHAARSHGLLRLLIALRLNGCAHDLDRIYALLSLRGAGDIDIYPDYAMSVRQVYVSVMVEMLKTQPQMLCYAGIAHRLTDNEQTEDISQLRYLCKELPSWVCDWRIPKAHQSFFFNVGTIFSAASKYQGQVVKYRPIDGEESSIEKQLSESILHVRSLWIDVVQFEKSPGSFKSLDLEQVRKLILEIKDFHDLHHRKIRSPPGEDALTQFARTIIADCRAAATRKWIPKPQSGEELVKLWLRFQVTPFMAHNRDSARFESDESFKPRPALAGGLVYALSDLYGYRVALKDILDDRTFFITHQGRVGLAPTMVREGDIIVLVAGVGAPVVLRPGQCAKNGSYLWYLVGDCYLHGVMYGEYFESTDPELVSNSWRTTSFI